MSSNSYDSSNRDYMYFLPDDIITLMDIKSIYNLSKISSYKHIEDCLNVIIYDDIDLKKALICSLEHDVNYSCFTKDIIFEFIQHMYDNTKITDILEIIPKFNDLSEINSTFYIFQILGMYSVVKYKKQLNNDTNYLPTITLYLVKYFKKVFLKKHYVTDMKLFEETHNNVIIILLSHSNTKWYVSCINLYYIYENIITIMMKKHKIKTVYNNINSDDYMIYDNCIHSDVHTLGIMLTMNSSFNNLNVKLYSSFNFFKTINRLVALDITSINYILFDYMSDENITSFKKDLQELKNCSNYVKRMRKYIKKQFKQIEEQKEIILKKMEMQRNGRSILRWNM